MKVKLEFNADNQVEYALLLLSLTRVIVAPRVFKLECECGASVQSTFGDGRKLDPKEEGDKAVAFWKEHVKHGETKVNQAAEMAEA